MGGPSVTKLRTLLRREPSAKLTGRGRFRGFSRLDAKGHAGRKMRGLTRMLEERIHSAASLPSIAKRATQRRVDAGWRGKGGGRRRGIAVDAQLSAIANGRKVAPANVYRLTRLALAALRAHRIVPVRGQQPVVCDRANVASAVDVVGVRGADELVLVELKTGYDNGRLAPATSGGAPQNLRSPLGRACDCVAHRHLAQLAATASMFSSDRRLMGRLRTAGIERVSATLVYVTDEDVEVINLPEWWTARGGKILSALA
jgi:hypothetical protein